MDPWDDNLKVLRQHSEVTWIVSKAIEALATDFDITQHDGSTGSPGKSQEKGQEDRGTSNLLRDLSSSWPSFWLFPELPVNP